MYSAIFPTTLLVSAFVLFHETLYDVDVHVQHRSVSYLTWRWILLCAIQNCYPLHFLFIRYLNLSLAEYIILLLMFLAFELFNALIRHRNINATIYGELKWNKTWNILVIDSWGKTVIVWMSNKTICNFYNFCSITKKSKP